MRLAEAKESFGRLGAEVYALSVDPPESVKGLQETLGMGVTLLSDPEGKAIEAFGMIDPSPFPPRRMARSGTFVIDAEGRVRESSFGGSYRERPDPEAILRLLR